VTGDGDIRVPFGFRQDVEPEPAELPEQVQKEINNTTCSTSATWQPVIFAPVTVRDTPARKAAHD
jgi:hypothetical protein